MVQALLKLKYTKEFKFGCRGKQSFKSYKAGEVGVRSLLSCKEREGKLKDEDKTLHPYYCRFCEHFHIGHNRFGKVDSE